MIDLRPITDQIIRSLRNTMPLSPHEIKILLHHHCICEPWNSESGASRDSITKFMEMGVLEVDNRKPTSGYITTELGKAWVHALCNVPCPRVAFLDEQGREIVG